MEKRTHSWLPLSLLAAASLCLLFANGRDTVALCAWLAPLLLLRFARWGPARMRLPAAYLTLSLTFAFQFRGMIPFPGAAFYIFSFGIGLALLLPYVADRYLAAQRPGLARTLVFPLTLVCIEFLLSLGPYGTWCSIAYSQSGQLMLLQVLSVTGLYGITFLIGWFAAVGNALWEAGGTSAATRELTAFGLVIGAVLTFGGGRLVFFAPRSRTVRIASITGPDPDALPEPERFRQLSARLFAGEQLSDTEVAVVRRRATDIADVLLAQADAEGRAGARVITFGEGEFPVLKADEPHLVQRCASLARERGMYLGLPLATLDVGRLPSVEDKLVLVTPSGDVAWRYLKTQLVPGFEMREFARSEGQLPLAITPFGRMSGAIAFDMDFPALLRQAGRQRADLVIVPEDDSRNIDPLHSEMAVFRAIENGFNLVLHASDGLSLATDYQGHVYGRMDRYQSSEHVLVAQVPTRGVATLASRIGYWFPLVCFLALLAVAKSDKSGQSRAAGAASTAGGEVPS